MVVHVQPMQQVGDELIVLDGLASRGEFIRKATHMSVVCSNRLVALLCIDQSSVNVVNTTQRLRGKHACERRPESVRDGDRGHRDQHFLGEVVEEVAEHLLVLPHPDGMERVQLGRLLAFLVLGDEEAGGFRHGPVDIAEEPGSPQLRRNLSSPQDVVRPGELLRDLTEIAWGGAGGRHGLGLWSS